MNANLARRCKCLLSTKPSFQRTGISIIAAHRQSIFKRLLYSNSMKCKPLVLPYHSIWMKNKFSMLPCITSIRLASKKAKKNKTSSKGGGGGGKLDTSVGDGIYDLNVLKIEMENSIEKLKDELHRKYSPSLTIGTLDNIYITIDGNSSPLYEIAQVAAQEKEFLITPLITGKNIEKQIITGIDNTGLNLNPRITDKVITISKPISSTDYKTNLLKLSKVSAEKSKNTVRKMRQHAMSQLKKTKDVSKDALKAVEKQVDLLMESSMQNIDKLVDAKKAEFKL